MNIVLHEVNGRKFAQLSASAWAEAWPGLVKSASTHRWLVATTDAVGAPDDPFDKHRSMAEPRESGGTQPLGLRNPSRRLTADDLARRSFCSWRKADVRSGRTVGPLLTHSGSWRADVRLGETNEPTTPNLRVREPAKLRNECWFARMAKSRQTYSPSGLCSLNSRLRSRILANNCSTPHDHAHQRGSRLDTPRQVFARAQ